MTTPDKGALRDLDPVCGMVVQPDSPQRFTYNGQDFVFCSPRCLELFRTSRSGIWSLASRNLKKLRLRPLQKAREPQRRI
jgi:YHS domain-containing protein